jgi:hypothetical protein
MVWEEEPRRFSAGKLGLFLLALAAGAMVLRNLPDLRRYIRIERM